MVTTLKTRNDIIAPAKQETSTDEENTEKESELFNEKEAARLLRGSNKDEYRVYRSTLLKPALKIMNKNWTHVKEIEGEI